MKPPARAAVILTRLGLVLGFFGLWEAGAALGWLDARFAYWFNTEDWKPLVE